MCPRLTRAWAAREPRPSEEPVMKMRAVVDNEFGDLEGIGDRRGIYAARKFRVDGVSGDRRRRELNLVGKWIGMRLNLYF